ncbi:ABC transporter ATP-binding protein [Couchioplanes azureus]|uniref:ABC transporter ATP-binding protein n=1 Tax=Couchioplanes caeruleus TaxID=56438 RepID=UPI00166FD027|nr:ATP-binding cassette domain-containing protein [Couchioplanes caeruleus]GGQ50743.1 multidrug ABC transporter ATP-binding protein [Couchioplanes caeruleus subsp. azureus]
MIEAHNLTKRYGPKLAVDELSFTVRPGVVTGFLGPNGAGKSTTMRLILGLDTPTSGSVLVNGRPYRAHRAPLHEVGALLEARSVHPGRTAFHHLLALARTNGIRRSRVDDVLEAVGLSDAARRRAGRFSLGMGQRLGIATALLGDPRTIILDEPLNGLDTEGIRWVRALLQSLAAEGRTVFLSSHLMNEMALTAQHLVIVGKGRLIADIGMADFVRARSRSVVRVRTTEPQALIDRLAGPDVEVTVDQGEALTVSGLTTDQIGRTAGAAGITLLELTAQQSSLEEAFIDLTGDAVEYRAATVGAPS